MPTVVTTIRDPERAREARLARSDLLTERADGDGRFVVERGPFDHWERVLEPTDDGDPDALVQTVRYRLAIPVWRGAFNPMVNAAIRKPPPAGTIPWWSPPDRLDAAAARAISLLCVLALFAGYLGALIGQTNTFVKSEFDVSDGEISSMLAATRLAALFALALVALADRRGRRWVLIFAAVAGCVATATGALTPDLVSLGISQTVARTFSTALAVVIGIYAVESMPAGSRAFAVSVLGMSGALGAGICVMALPIAGIGDAAWRLLYLVPLAAIPAVLAIARVLPETERFLLRARRNQPDESADDLSPIDSPAIDSPAIDHGPMPPQATTGEDDARGLVSAVPHTGSHRRRFILLAVSALLLGLFTAPSSQLLNEYLRTEQGFEVWRISLFTILTNTPGGIGVIIGGRLADTRGRRVVGAVAVGAGVAFTVFMYLGSGWWIWLWSVLGAVIGAAALPALGVYGPELFPTSSRGSANGGINLAAVIGAVVGLLAAGAMADAFGGLPMAIAVLSIGPAVIVLLILFLYPETAHRELEELNPEDIPPPTR